MRSIFKYKIQQEVKIVHKKYECLLVKLNKTSYKVAKDTGIAQSILSDCKRGGSS